MPPVGHDEEPYLWLLRSLPEADERYDAEKEFAKRVAVLLLDGPDVKRPGKRPDQVLYNLFMLSAGLSCPDELAIPLHEVYERRSLRGKRLGVDVRTALKAALIVNQRDSRLQSIWEQFLQKRNHQFLPGDEWDGFEGIRLMPESEDRRGEPALDALGRALKAMAEYLESDQARVNKSHYLVVKIMDTYPGRPTWDTDLLLQALKQEWPSWTVESIPGQYPQYICGLLRHNPYASPRSAAGIIAHGLAEIEGQLPKERPEAKSIEKAHKTSLKSLAVGA